MQLFGPTVKAHKHARTRSPSSKYILVTYVFHFLRMQITSTIFHVEIKILINDNKPEIGHVLFGLFHV